MREAKFALQEHGKICLREIISTITETQEKLTKQCELLKEVFSDVIDKVRISVRRSAGKLIALFQLTKESGGYLDELLKLHGDPTLVGLVVCIEWNPPLTWRTAEQPT